MPTSKTILSHAHSADRFDKLGGSYIQATRQLDDVDEAYIALPAFDAAHIVAVQVSQFSQLLLRQLALQSQLAYSSAEHNARVSGHAAIILTMTTMSLHTMSVIGFAAMLTLPSLNPRHKIGLVLTLAATGTSLLLGVSAKQTTGIVLLGLAMSWFIGSVDVRTLGMILSVITLCVGLYVAVRPIWNERETVLAMAREYDAIVVKIRLAAERNEEYGRDAMADKRAVEKGTATVEQIARYNARLVEKDFESQAYPAGLIPERPPAGAILLAEPIQYHDTVDIPAKWLRGPSPEDAIAARYGGSLVVSLGNESEEEVMRVFQTKVLLPRPTFSLKGSISFHRMAFLGGGSLSLLGLLSCVLLIWRATLGEPPKP